MDRRRKGHDGERELAALLTRELGSPVTRNLTQARAGGADLEGLSGFALEVKRSARITPALITRWWKQTEEQAKRTDALPVLAVRADRGEWRFTLPMRAFVPWAKQEDGLVWTAEVGLPVFLALVAERRRGGNVAGPS